MRKPTESLRARPEAAKGIFFEGDQTGLVGFGETVLRRPALTDGGASVDGCHEKPRPFLEGAGPGGAELLSSPRSFLSARFLSGKSGLESGNCGSLAASRAPKKAKRFLGAERTEEARAAGLLSRSSVAVNVVRECLAIAK